MKEENLIFIASQPRAGSTFLQNVLSNNSQTNTVSEPWLMLTLSPLFKPSLVSKTTYDHKIATEAVNYFQDKVGIRLKDEVRALALKMYDPLFKDFDFVIDKTPRYWEILEDLIIMFPKSKIIILQRNPLDVVKSMITTWNIESLEKLNYFRRDLLSAPKAIDGFLEKNKNNPNVISIYYDKLVEDNTKEIEDLYNTLGINFDNSVLDTTNNTKHKGEFGDPYQNGKKKTDSKLKKEFNDFILGYADYLGEDYFLKHNFLFEKKKPTRAFNYFLNLGAYKQEAGLSTLKHELSLLIKRIRIKYS